MHVQVEAVSHRRFYRFPFPRGKDRINLATLMIMAFKEWAVVCDALGAGRQSVLIRKGGIAEGRAGFEFKHDRFLLFPTWFHEQVASTTLPADTIVPPAPTDEITLQFAGTVEWTGLVTDLAAARRLADLHVLRDSVVEERFHYDQAEGVHVAFVRAHRLEPSFTLPLEKRYGGCRSWVEMPEPPASHFTPALDDAEHTRRRKLLDAALHS